jgi:hypothetical protein
MSMSTIDVDDKSAVESFKEMLSFYGVQLQSHASIILGLALLVFASVQAWGQLGAESRSRDALVFSVFQGLFGMSIVYYLWRLYLWGKLSSALMYSSKDAFNENKTGWTSSGNKPEWSDLLPMLKVNVYSHWVLERFAARWIKLKILNKSPTGRIRLSLWVMITTFWLGFIVSYSLVFAGWDEVVGIVSVLMMVPVYCGLKGIKDWFGKPESRSY